MEYPKKYLSQNAIKSMAAKDRPREKFMLYGKSYLTDTELVAILLGSGTQTHSAIDLARLVLKKFQDDLHVFGKADIKDLEAIKGIGKAKAITLSAALELGRRRHFFISEEKPQIVSSRQAYEVIAADLIDKQKEELWGIFLSRSNKLIYKKKLSEGGLSATTMDPKVIFYEALGSGCSGFILAHNHPSGNMKPSNADIINTKRIIEGGNFLDLHLLDHIIVAGNSYTSLADEGYISCSREG